MDILPVDVYIFTRWDMFICCIIFYLKSEYHLALLGYLPFTNCLFKGYNENKQPGLDSMACLSYSITDPDRKLQSYLYCLYFI